MSNYDKQFNAALQYFKDADVGLEETGFLTRIAELNLEFEVLTLAHSYCTIVEYRVERPLTKEEICQELNDAAYEWDV